MPAAGSLPNSMHGCFMQVKVHLPIGLLSAISGILAGGSWVSALLIGLCFAPSLRSCCDVCFGCFLLVCKIFLIHWHISCLLRRSSSFDWSFCLVWFCFCFGFCLFCLRPYPMVDSGLRNGPRSSFDSPMRDADSCTV